MLKGCSGQQTGCVVNGRDMATVDHSSIGDLVHRLNRRSLPNFYRFQLKDFHRRGRDSRRGLGEHVSQKARKIRKKIFLGNYHVNFGYFVNFSYIIFMQKCLARPQKLTELLCLWRVSRNSDCDHFQRWDDWKFRTWKTTDRFIGRGVYPYLPMAPNAPWSIFFWGGGMNKLLQHTKVWILCKNSD